MTTLVTFPYHPELITIRRTAAPAARWDGMSKTWEMSDAEAASLRRAFEERLASAISDFCRSGMASAKAGRHTEMSIDDLRNTVHSRSDRERFEIVETLHQALGSMETIAE